MSAQSPSPMLPKEATPIGTAAGLLEGPDGGVVFVFGLATFAFDAGDAAGRRLAAVQLVVTKAAKASEVAGGFDVDPVTLWRWEKAYAAGGVAGLVPGRTGPKGPTKLTAERVHSIRELAGQGLGLQAIADRSGVSTFSVRVALGRVRPRKEPVTPEPAEEGSPEEEEPVSDERVVPAPVAGEPAAEVEKPGPLPVLADPVHRGVERQAARAGTLSEAPVRFTEGARLPLAGLLLVLPALAQVGLLEAAEGVYGRLGNGFYGLRATLLTLVFLALLRDPRAEGLTRIRPADLGRILGLDRAPEVKTLRRKLTELAKLGRGAQLIEALARRHISHRPEVVGFLYLDGHVRVYTGTRSLPKTHIAADADLRPCHRRNLGRRRRRRPGVRGHHPARGRPGHRATPARPRGPGVGGGPPVHDVLRPGRLVTGPVRRAGRRRVRRAHLPQRPLA